MQSNSFLYSLRIWLTSVGLAPVIYLLIRWYTERNDHSSLNDYLSGQITIYAICLVFGGIFSVITWVIFIFVIEMLVRCFPLLPQLKLIIALAGMLLTIGTFSLFFSFPGFGNELFYLMLSNCICIAAGSFFYKLSVTSGSNTDWK